MEKLFTPFQIKQVALKNRVVMPPVFVSAHGIQEGSITERHINHYTEIAKGGAGLIIVEASAVDENGRITPQQPGIWDDCFIDGYRQIVDGCHAFGAKVFLQLHHAGLFACGHEKRTSSDYTTVRKKQISTGWAMHLTELKEVQNLFLQGALRAEKAGFDGIELHCVHGYLLSQFLSPKINRRTDLYGGSLENCLRLPMEIFQAIRAQVDSNLIVGVRLGSNEATLKDSIFYAQAFEKAGADYLHISVGFDNEIPEDLDLPETLKISWIAYAAGEIKKTVTVPIIAVNKITTPELAAYILDNQIADLVALGRAQLADPHWTNKAMKKEPFNLCRNCKGCRWFTDPAQCTARLIKPKQRHP